MVPFSFHMIEFLRKTDLSIIHKSKRKTCQQLYHTGDPYGKNKRKGENADSHHARFIS
jgi:hypothetical protein